MGHQKPKAIEDIENIKKPRRFITKYFFKFIFLVLNMMMPSLIEVKIY
jgi:hypothetical protein